MNAPKITVDNNDIIYNLNETCWKLDIKNRNSHWSFKFIEDLGYDVDDISIGIDYFLVNLIHKNDSTIFRDNFYGFVEFNIHFKQVVRILNKSNNYYEYVAYTDQNSESTGGLKTIIFEKSKIKIDERIADKYFYYLETAEITSTGSWHVDFEKRKSYWDRLARKILEYPEEYIPSVKEAHKYFPKEHHEIAGKVFFACASKGKPFNTEMKMLTSNNRALWVRVMGKAIYNSDNREIIGIRGIFQDIDDAKNKELSLKKTSDIIALQNSRLFNFAHIVSHNLRSHSSNLQLIVELIKNVDDQKEKLELIDNVEDISLSLNSTIEHLNEIVSVQAKVNQKRVLVLFNNTLNSIKTSISQIIKQQNATIYSDFSKVETIKYIPAYLDSIILNLITNAIKYRHSERDPIISLKTYLEDSKIILEVSDNGAGIDLEKYGDKLFGMYNTFHFNEDAVGIGLFITKSQIESLKGEIFVESEVGIGTTFKIKF